MQLIFYYRNCVMDSDLVANFVTFHLYFPMNHMPANLAVNYSCNDLVEDPSGDAKNTYRVQQGLDYPVNIGRMIARETATTHFIFAADVELYPRFVLFKEQTSINIFLMNLFVIKLNFSINTFFGFMNK